MSRTAYLMEFEASLVFSQGKHDFSGPRNFAPVYATCHRRIGDGRNTSPLVRVLAAAVGAVAAFGHVEELVNVGIQLGDPVARHQERRQIEQIHKHFVAVTKGTESHSSNAELVRSHDFI